MKLTMKNKLAEIKISYTRRNYQRSTSVVRCSRDAYELLVDNWDKRLIELLEEFKLLLLDRANKVLGIVHLSRGGTAGTVVDAKLVFATALQCNAHGIILAHNHPSGNTKPSQTDLDLTKRLTDGGRMLDIQVLDHLIITTRGYWSFADEGG